MFPLTLKQTRSMKSMQEIQPEVKRLQKELKGDKQALQEATMALYREKGVNPAAGCLPLLLQMPIWFALFRVLRQFSAVEDPARFLPDESKLEAAAQGVDPLSFLWMDMKITPSEAFTDTFVTAIPYLITIFVVMGTAYWQQRQTMARSQKNGQFISFSLPAGLVVYFAASQIFRIGQQALIIGMDDRRKESEASKPKPKVEETKPSKKTDSKSSKKSDSKPATPAKRPAAQRRPQGSKKKRGKKRRRR